MLSVGASPHGSATDRRPGTEVRTRVPLCELPLRLGVYFPKLDSVLRPTINGVEVRLGGSYPAQCELGIPIFACRWVMVVIRQCINLCPGLMAARTPACSVLRTFTGPTRCRYRLQ